MGAVRQPLLAACRSWRLVKPYYSSPITPRRTPRRRWSLTTTAYTGVPGDGRLGRDQLTFDLPLTATLPGIGGGEKRVQIDTFHPSEWSEGMNLMNSVIREGTSWPFETEFATLTDYRAYFLSHAAFCVKEITPNNSTNSSNSSDDNGSPPALHSNRILGCFYIKPNFPGRCSHVCNGGFITSPFYRRLGVARLMGHVFLQAASDFGYQSSYFNLVFASNVASVQLWESLGFERVAVLHEAARLKGVPGLDTAYGYRYNLTTLPPNYLQNVLTKYY